MGNFNLRAAVWTSGNGYWCPDEDSSCPMTKWVLCGFGATETSSDQKIMFLTCWDESTGTPEEKAEVCAQGASLDFPTISSCFSGTMGEDLLKAANQEFEK